MRRSFGSVVLILSLSACTGERGDLGSAENPVKMFFVPSVDAAALTQNAKVVESYLKEHTPYHYKTAVPASYIAVVEAFGTNRADVAALTTFSYVLAHDKYGAQALLAIRRDGQDTYAGQIIVRTDSGIEKLEDLAGKKFAYVDPASASGYILAAKLFRDRGIKLGETVFARSHDNVVTMVYNRQVDGGATFNTPPADGRIQDARSRVLTQFPDVEQQVKILAMTEAIPNEPFVFRKDMPEEMKKAICDALLAFIATEEGKKTFEALYRISELRRVTDADYDVVRKMLEELQLDASELVKK